MPSTRRLPEGYEGREQAFVKHTLLENYLQKLFLIVGMSSGRHGAKPELCYVDCFAGPWGDPNESLATTSIAISLRTLNSCRDVLASNGIYARIRALYIEEKAAPFARLKDYLASNTPAGVEAECLQGDFVSLRSKILEWIGPRAFTFFFIDPTGWKEIGIPVLTPLLKRSGSEFLINFMYNDINRTMSMVEWQPKMRDLLGRTISLDGLQPDQRERTILDTYRKSCKACIGASGGQPRSAYARIMDPNRNRPKYHLVYFTSHPRGVVEFMKISQSVSLVQRHVRASLQQKRRFEKERTEDMFANAELASQTVEAASPTEVDEFWRALLRSAGGSKTITIDDFADILETTDWFEDELQASLARLIDARKVSNADAPKRRPKRPLHFEMYGGETIKLENMR